MVVTRFVINVNVGCITGNDLAESYQYAAPGSNTNTIVGLTHSSNDQLEALTDDFFQWRLQTWPIYATRVGNTTYDDQLTQYTEEAFVQQKVFKINFIFEFYN